ncbi:Hypothetical protein, putative, partial [Bodo saltans]
VVITDMDGVTMSFTILHKHLSSLLGVALYYCPPDTPVHHISGSTVPLFESLANVKKPSSKGVIASVVGFLQHAGQDNSGQESLEFLRSNDSKENDDEDNMLQLDIDERLALGGAITKSETRESMLAAAEALRRKNGDPPPPRQTTNVNGLAQRLDQMPIDEGLSDMLREYAVLSSESPDRSGSVAAASPQMVSNPVLVGTARSPSQQIPKPRASSVTPNERDAAERRRMVSIGLPAGLEKLAHHRGESIDFTPGRRSRALPGDEELYSWKALNTTTASSPAQPLTSLRFAQGGTSLAITPRIPPHQQQQHQQQLLMKEMAKKEETGAMLTVMKELRSMQDEINRLKAESHVRLQDDWVTPNSHSHHRRGRSVGTSEDEDDGGSSPTARSPDASLHKPHTTPIKPAASPSRTASFSASSSSQKNILASQPNAKSTATVSDNVRGSLLPLMSLSSQHAAIKAIEELQEIQRGLLDAAGSKYINPTVQRMLHSMEDPLRVLFRIVAPAVTPVMAEHAQVLGPILPSATSTGEFLPVWALVDFGEVNYDRSPLTLRQYHRIVARRVDEEGMSHVMIATRQQFALDEGYIQVPFSSVLDVAFGCQPRGVVAQRLLMDGSITRSDELHDDKSAISIRTRLQHIQIQFESVADCNVWARVLQEVVVANTKRLPLGQVSSPAVEPKRGDPSQYLSATAMIAAEDL